MGRKDQVVRFGVGDFPTRYSAVWRLWAADPTASGAKSDIYLASRSIGATFKTSLHESGRWRVGYTRESNLQGVDVVSGGDRKLAEWSRPKEMSPGVTLAYLLVVPSSELRPGPADDPLGQGVYWVADPGPGRAVEFALGIIAPQIQELRLSEPGSSLMATLNLANGERAVLVSRPMDMPPDMPLKLREAGASLVRAATESSVGVESARRPRMMLFLESSLGVRGIFDVAVPCTV
jgi:hypothetical protein